MSGRTFLQTEYPHLPPTPSSTENWISMMQDYSKLEALDRPTLLRLIDRIEIGERRVVDGRDERDIRIFYKFVGLIEV